MKEMKKLFITTLVIVLSIAFFAACGNQESEAPVDNGAAKEEETTSFGAFDSKTFEGKDVKADVFKNSELTMVNIWGTFCGPCINEMPDLEKLSKEYDREKFQIIGLVSDNATPGDESVREILDKTGVTYTQIMNSESLSKGILSAVQAVPTTVFVDREGKIVNVSVGGKSYKDWKNLVDDIMESM